MSTVIRARFDWMYGAQDWRSQKEMSFQLSMRSHVEYRVADGQVVQTVETITEFGDPIGGVPADIIAGPPYLFADRTYRRDVAESLMTTHVITKSYSTYGDNSYQVTVDDYNALTGQTTHTVSIVAGKIPLAPTTRSILTSLTQRPLVGVLQDPCIGGNFVPSKLALDLPWAEGPADMCRAGKRALQRASAIVRKVKMRANTLIKIGDTARLINAKRALFVDCMVVARTIDLDPETGNCTELLETEDWVR